MMTQIRMSQSDDQAAIAQLLQEVSLPYEDIEDHLANFCVLEDNEKIVGCGGLECYDNVALLRSVAVMPSQQGMALGKMIYQYLNDYALNQGVDAFYLLTETAQDYFQQLGFTVIERDHVPANIQKTQQFSSLCPASAIVMRRLLLA